MLNARPGNAMALEEIHRELHIHRRLGALPEKLTISETGVPVTQHQIGSALEDRQISSGSLVHPVVVEIAAVLAHRSGRDRLVNGRSDADAADRRMRLEFDLHLVS